MRGRARTSKIVVGFFLILAFLFFFQLIRLFLVWKKSEWDGKSQLSLALKTRSQKIVVLTLTPAKNMAIVLIIPANLVIETPWFGDYRADKLSLLTRQEGKDAIFFRSLGYFLGIPIDSAMINSEVIFDQVDETEIKGALRRFFSPWRSIDNFKIWFWLKKRDLVWRVIDLEAVSQKKTLPDGSAILAIDSARASRTLQGLFTDPLVKNENITISVFNAGGPPGIAQRIATIITSFGGRVIEIADAEQMVDQCLILFSRGELTRTITFQRLESILGCPKEQGRGGGLGEIQIFMKNVKI